MYSKFFSLGTQISYCQELKIKTLKTLINNNTVRNLIFNINTKGKRKRFKAFFAVQGGNQAVLGMPDIDNLGVLTINCETLGRQVV